MCHFILQKRKKRKQKQKRKTTNSSNLMLDIQVNLANWLSGGKQRNSFECYTKLRLDEREKNGPIFGTFNFHSPETIITYHYLTNDSWKPFVAVSVVSERKTVRFNSWNDYYFPPLTFSICNERHTMNSLLAIVWFKLIQKKKKNTILLSRALRNLLYNHIRSADPSIICSHEI